MFRNQYRVIVGEKAPPFSACVQDLHAHVFFQRLQRLGGCLRKKKHDGKEARLAAMERAGEMYFEGF
jgi:hypothetical protein